MRIRKTRVQGLALLCAAFAAGGLHAAGQKGHGMAAVFDRYDGDGDGALDRAELGAYLERRRLPERFKGLWAFANVDADRDGAVSLEEWSRTLQEEMNRRRGR